MQVIQQPKNPTLAAILSFLIPGLGQIYNGEVGKGILIIVVHIVNAILAMIIIGFFTGLAVLVWAIYDAYKVAERINLQYVQQYGAGYAPQPTAAYPQLNAPYNPAPTGPMVQPPAQPAMQAGQKQCPRCAEMVQSAAKVCRYCGYEFEAQNAQPDL
jgi:TM2 domain-containing membrane protein YozV